MRRPGRAGPPRDASDTKDNKIPALLSGDLLSAPVMNLLWVGVTLLRVLGQAR